MNSFLIFYFLIISLIGVFIFAVDKRAAKRGRRRIPEKILHLFELLGGVFLMLPAMHIFHHKNKKFGYYILTYLILLVWIFVLYEIVIRGTD